MLLDTITATSTMRTTNYTITTTTTRMNQAGSEQVYGMSDFNRDLETNIEARERQQKRFCTLEYNSFNSKF